MIYLILAILVVLPLIVSGVLILKSKIDLSLAKAYMLEMIIMLIIGAIGHFYYHQAYGLNYFPTWSFAKFFLILFLVMTIVLFLIQLFLYWFKKKEILSFQSYMILFIGMSLFFVWIIPLGQKYVYIDRLDDVEEMFAEGGS